MNPKIITECTENLVSDQCKEVETKRTIGSLSGRYIEIVTCDYGTGHKAVAAAVQSLIELAGGQTSIYNLTQDAEALRIVDPLFHVTEQLGVGTKVSHFFNWILSNQLSWVFSGIERVQQIALKICGRSLPFTCTEEGSQQSAELGKLIKKRFQQNRPDMVVTTYHMNINPFREVCNELKIPLLHIPTDFTVKAREMFSISPQDPKFFCLLPATNSDTIKSAEPISRNKLIPYGIPLRAPLYRQYSQEEISKIKKEKGIDPEAKVIVVMSGGGGQDRPFPDLLLKSISEGKKYHMIVIAGANNSAGDRVQKLSEQVHADMTVQVATDPEIATKERKYYVGATELSKLLAIADCGISKPGGVSLFEFLHVGVPVLIDCPITPLSWEGDNREIMVKMQRGLSYTGTRDFLEQIDEVITLGKKSQSLPDGAGFVEIVKNVLKAG